jgi:hypothetical protein
LCVAGAAAPCFCGAVFKALGTGTVANIITILKSISYIFKLPELPKLERNNNNQDLHRGKTVENNLGCSEKIKN